MTTASRKRHSIHRQVIVSLETASLDASLEAKSVSESSGMLSIEWTESDHVSQLPLAWLRDHCMSKVERDRRAPQPVLWEGSAAQSRVHDYGEMVSSAHALYHFMADIRDFGFARVTSVPVEHHSVTKVVELFGYVRETNYGRVFDVESTVDAVHLAYTPVALSMHTDNVYETLCQVFSFFIAWRPVSAAARPFWWMDLKLQKLYATKTLMHSIL